MDDEERGYVSRFLTHFVGRGKSPDEQYDLLLAIIRSGRLLPGGKEENAPGNVALNGAKPFSSDELFLPQVVCFCDIPLEEEMLQNHTQKYSRFGLAFDKKWLAKTWGVNPVLYVAIERFAPTTNTRGHPNRDFSQSVLRPCGKRLVTEAARTRPR